ncbi:acyltransferase family protein [Mucilaginibacter sp. X4EP1]|uniref:acyltransferase family protein n=1 Tax=Mucilaginibacter sp. X4EP1 TaxID=2723092 RepID=UPI002169362C|nr:acyltransferase [Mucilaginibacter sp. X4EP1]MCS3815432.1 peptidoglycan/LPS O-acetylase OafA/YrhL [Mucilaginibacter sp. X4EP1]
MSKYIPSLNGLRAISISIVILYHLYYNNFFPKNNIVLKAAGNVLFNGSLGVNIFFVISGFLITTLLLIENEQNGSISLKKFYIRRVLRIFPGYYFLLLVYAILQFSGYLHFDRINWFSNITYTKQFFMDETHESGHLWSLSVEEVFYLIWPFIFIKFNTNRVKIIWSLIIVITTARFFQISFWPNSGLSLTIFGRGDALLVGCLFAIKNNEIVYWVKEHRRWCLMIFPLLIVFILLYNYINHLALKNVGAHQFTILSAMIAPLCYTLVGSIGLFTNMLIGLIIIFSINIQNLWFSFLNTSVMSYIGKLSYSLYLWQQLFTADKPFLHQMPIIIIFLLIFISANISYFFVEKPFLKIKNKFSTKTAKQIPLSQLF